MQSMSEMNWRSDKIMIKTMTNSQTRACCPFKRKFTTSVIELHICCGVIVCLLGRLAIDDDWCEIGIGECSFTLPCVKRLT